MIEQIKNHERNQHIEFDAKEHRYFYKGEEFQGVTSLINNYTKPFDPSIAEFIAYRDGITVEQVKQNWEDARQYGNEVHKQIEQLVKFNLDVQSPEIDNFKQAMESKKLTPIETEWVVYNEDIKTASMIDLVCLDENDQLVIVDLKTMAKPIKRKAYKDRMMSHPLNTLPDCKYYKQCLQVGLYRDWVVNKYKLPVSKEYVLRLRDDIWKFIPVLRVEPEIEKLYKFHDK